MPTATEDSVIDEGPDPDFVRVYREIRDAFREVSWPLQEYAVVGRVQSSMDIERKEVLGAIAKMEGKGEIVEVQPDHRLTLYELNE